MAFFRAYRPATEHMELLFLRKKVCSANFFKTSTARWNKIWIFLMKPKEKDNQVGFRLNLGFVRKKVFSAKYILTQLRGGTRSGFF
jgi:hypothetical protein